MTDIFFLLIAFAIAAWLYIRVRARGVLMRALLPIMIGILTGLTFMDAWMLWCLR